MIKLFKAFYVVVILLVSLGATLQSCSSSDPTTLAKEYAEAINKMCPIDEGDGTITKEAIAQGSTVIIKMEVEDADMLSQFNKEIFVKEAKNHESTKEITENGVTMKFTICNGDQCKSFTITKDDLK